jgi:ankyrin repeat protein
VFCLLDSLRRCLPGRIRRALDELPATLDGTYERTLLDIDEQNWSYAHRLFQCITVASRPLRVEELAEFLAFDFDEGDNPRFEADWRPEDPLLAVLTTCSSLIEVVNVSDRAVVQFSHFSVKEFLTSTRMARGRVSRYYIPLEPAHLTIVRGCLTALLSLDSSVNKATIKNLPLAFYAARYWVDHAKFGNVSLHAQDAIQQIFDPAGPYFSAWAWLEDYDESRQSISNTPSTPEVPPLHRAVLSDFGHIAEWLITSRSQDPNEFNARKTPLYHASGRGSLKVAQLLIKHGADVNAQHSFGWRPLHFASNNGHLEILRLLVGSGAEVNSRDNDDWTPLLLASVEGHLEVVRFLLENGADPNVRCWDGTPLLWALERDHLEVAQLLLTYGADINTPDMHGETLLHWASKSGHQTVARQLLESGANIHARHRASRTPMQVASAAEHQDIMRLLPQYGAEGS